MKLIELIENLDAQIFGDTDIEIDEIVYDSRKVKAGCAFVCLKGENADGHDYVNIAERNGAKVIISEKKVETKLTQIVCKSTRKALSILFSNYYSNPQKDLKMIAITGTNGKTTSSFLIKNILEESGKKVGLIGTQGAFIGKQFFETGMTTPDPEILFKLFFEMRENGVEYVVMEASAHALELEKLEGIIFDVGVFTNFTQDHLDFFKTMERYKKSKLKLFSSKMIKSAVLNFDDPVGKEISKTIDVPFVSYGLYSPCDIFAINIDKKASKTEYVVNLLDNIFSVQSYLLGEFNIYNSLGSAGACALLGVSEKNIKHGLETLESVPGRLNSIPLSNGATAIIDFAHTPDGVEKVLTTLSNMPFRRIITVVGCGGNRDKTKRPQMGKISEDLSDFVVLTSDNPRFENPELIIDDIEFGMKKTTHTRIVDRTVAVRHAIEISKHGDVIAILGKGAEEYQDINGVKSPYNDYEVVRDLDEEMRLEKAILGGQI